MKVKILKHIEETKGRKEGRVEVDGEEDPDVRIRQIMLVQVSLKYTISLVREPTTTTREESP